MSTTEQGDNGPALPDAESGAAEWDPTKRNRYLRKLGGQIETFESTIRGRSQRRNAGNFAELTRQERKVTKILQKACGECGLSGSCEVAEDFPEWRAAHPYQSRTEMPEGVEPIESRNDLAQRLKTDPQGPCVLPPDQLREVA